VRRGELIQRDRTRNVRATIKDIKRQRFNTRRRGNSFQHDKDRG
jgi:hypothetical protein